MIKTVLVLENSTTPPSIKFLRPNLAIPFESAKLNVPTEPTAWPQGRLERVGGSNSHAVIDSAASFSLPSVLEGASDEPHLLLFSANSEKALTGMMDNYRAFAKRNSEGVRNLPTHSQIKGNICPTEASLSRAKAVLE